jgi:hypothetical protein
MLPVQAQKSLPGAEFAVGHVEEVVAAQDLAEALPGFPMGGVIGLVAGVSLEMDRDRSVGADGQAIDEVFEVGAVVLAEAAAPLHGVGFSMSIGAGKLDGVRGGVKSRFAFSIFCRSAETAWFAGIV